MGLFSDMLFLPAVVLALIAFMVPRVLGRMLPEGVWPLMLNALLSTVVLFGLSAGYFVLLYLWQGLSVADLMSPGWAANVLFFGRLGLVSGMIWGPIMVLSVAGLPRRWKTRTW